MEWVTLDRIADHAGKNVELRGRVDNRRSSGKARFLLVRDGVGVIRCVVEKSRVSAEIFELAGNVPQS